jgi:hypothetical protein
MTQSFLEFLKALPTSASFPSLKALKIPTVYFGGWNGADDSFTPRSFLEALSSTAPILEDLFMAYNANVDFGEHVCAIFLLGERNDKVCIC